MAGRQGRMAPRVPVPLPAGFRLSLAPGLRRPVPTVLIGGAPVRVLKLTETGASLLDGWAEGGPVGEGSGARTLAARLVEAGMADPLPPPAPQPTVAIVVPVKDDPAGLRATLEALAPTAPAVAVSVVDDGSEPEVVLPADQHQVTVVRRACAGGPAAARNTGVAALGPGTEIPDTGIPDTEIPDPEIVVFVDAGCVPDPGWLGRLVAHFADPGLAAVAPRVRSRASAGTPGLLARYERRRSPLDLGAEPGPVHPGARVAYVPTAVLAVRRTALREVGGFDEGLRFGEDVDLIWRLREQGWRIRYEPQASASHPVRPSIGAWLRQRYDYGRSAAPLAARHGRAVAPLTVSPWSLSSWMLAGAGRPLPAMAIAAGSAEVLARRAGPEPAVARELRRLAYLGNLKAGGPIATAVRRAWAPPALAAAALVRAGGRRRSRWWTAVAAMAILAGPGLADWWGGRGGDAPINPGSWVALRLADDLSYQAGVWMGAIRARSAAALLPRW